jgi:hypothetical protein
MTGWIFLFIYLVGVVVIPYPAYEIASQRMLENAKKNYPNLYANQTELRDPDKDMAMLVAGGAAVLWPVALVAYALISSIWATSRRIWTGSWAKENSLGEVIDVKPQRYLKKPE